MTGSPLRPMITTAGNLLGFFREELEAVFTSLGLRCQQETEAYLAHLLDGYTRMDAQSAEEIGFHRPAAFMLGDALQAQGADRIEAWRRLGDACLYSCGFFDERLARRNVDPRYYHQLGRDAYGNLRDMMRHRGQGGQTFSTIFGELAAKFDIVVQAFHRLARAHLHTPQKRLEAVLTRLERGERVSPEELMALGLMPSFGDDRGQGS